jgi:hypothetical protein
MSVITHEHQLKEAVEEAKRFLKKCDELKKKATERGDRSFYSLPRENGAVRRASLDLSRALANYRRSG